MAEQEFQEKLSILNENFLRYFQEAYEKSPKADFTPTVKAYLKHVKQLDDSYAEKDLIGEHRRDLSEIPKSAYYNSPVKFGTGTEFLDGFRTKTSGEPPFLFSGLNNKEKNFEEVGKSDPPPPPPPFVMGASNSTSNKDSTPSSVPLFGGSISANRSGDSTTPLFGGSEKTNNSSTTTSLMDGAAVAITTTQISSSLDKEKTASTPFSALFGNSSASTTTNTSRSILSGSSPAPPSFSTTTTPLLAALAKNPPAADSPSTTTTKSTPFSFSNNQNLLKDFLPPKNPPTTNPTEANAKTTPTELSAFAKALKGGETSKIADSTTTTSLNSPKSIFSSGVGSLKRKASDELFDDPNKGKRAGASLAGANSKITTTTFAVPDLPHGNLWKNTSAIGNEKLASAVESTAPKNNSFTFGSGLAEPSKRAPLFGSSLIAPPTTTNNTGNSALANSSSFGSSNAPTTTTTTNNNSSSGGGGLSFGGSIVSMGNAKSGFSFGSSINPPPPTSSSNSKPALTFGFQAPTSTTTTTTNTSNGKDDEEEEEPPKVEDVEQKEEDALCSIKCVVYNLSDGEFKKKGVGYASVKKIDDNKKQLIIRAATALGTVWTNVIINDSFKWKKMADTKLRLIYPDSTEPVGKEGAEKNGDTGKAPAASTLLLRVATSNDLNTLTETF